MPGRGRRCGGVSDTRNCDNPVTIVDKGGNGLILWNILHGHFGIALTLC